MTTPVNWTPEMDAELLDTIHRKTLVETSKHIGVSDWSVNKRLKELGLGVPRSKILNEPTFDDWVAAASARASAADIQLTSVLNGDRALISCRARALAWQDLTRMGKRWSYSGIARVSGYHSSSVSLALKALSGEVLRSRVPRKHYHPVIDFRPVPVLVPANTIPRGIRAFPRQKVA